MENFLKLLDITEINPNNIKKNKKINPSDIEDDFGKYNLNVVFKLNDRESTQLTYYELYHYLKYFYRGSNFFKRGLTCFEYFNAKNNEIKPRIDIDKKVTEIFHPTKGEKIKVSKTMNDPSVLEKYVEEVLFNIYTILKSLFPELEKKDYAISKDCRWITKNDETFFKVSYHIVLWNKKIESRIFKNYLIQNKELFETFNLWDAIDTKIYMSGFTKWRMPFCKKNSIDPNIDDSLLIPINYTDYDNYHKHIVTYIKDCDILELDITEVENKKEDFKYNSDAIDYISKMEDNNKEIQHIKRQFTIIGAPRLDDKLEYTDIEQLLCGKNHNNNHNYLIHDTLKGSLKVKCHSEKCLNFCKVLYTPKNNYKEFNIEYFNNIPLLDDQNDNYNSCKEYFEYFFKYMRDSNSFYRIDNTYDRRLKYYERKVKPVKIEGYSDLLFKEKSDDGEIKPKKFIEKYKNDSSKNAFFDLSFEPYNKKTDNEPVQEKNFNLFSGFNYDDILTYDQRNDIPEEKYKLLQKLLNHIKKYHCSNNDKHFDFFLQYFANIIQKPQFIPQIILIFYSSVHGTGKSNCTRFLAEVIGNALSFFGSLKQITDTHTNAHLGKLMNVIEEVDNYSTRQYENIIKDYSQRSYAQLNQKNKDIIQIKTFVRYIFTTNHYNGVYFDNEDRRYVVYTFNKIYDKNYVDEIQEIMNDNYVKYLFGKYLEEYEIKYNNPNDWNINRYKNEDYYNMMSEDPLKNFFKQLYNADYINIEEENSNDVKIDENDKEFLLIHYNKFTDYLKEFCKDNGEKQPKIMNIKKQLTSTYKHIISEKRLRKRKYYKINLFLLGEFLHQKEIKNNYNGYTRENKITEN